MELDTEAEFFEQIQFLGQVLLHLFLRTSDTCFLDSTLPNQLGRVYLIELIDIVV